MSKQAENRTNCVSHFGSAEWRLDVPPADSAENTGLSNVLGLIAQRLMALEQAVLEVRNIVLRQHFEKEWYTTGEVAEILGKSHYTIQERWCNEGRIECQKDHDTGKWRIPGHEVRRLRAGGRPLPRKM